MYKNTQLGEDRRFVIKHPQSIGMEVNGDLTSYWKRSQEEVSRGSSHKGHDFEKFRGQGRLEEDNSVWSSECMSEVPPV